MSEPLKMKPIIVLPLEAMAADHIEELRKNGICVVEAKEPSAIKLLDPVAAISSRTEIENAAIKLSRRLLRGDLVGLEYRKNVADLYVQILIEGTALSATPTQAERERDVYDAAKLDEVRKLAREDARIERAAAATAKKVVAEIKK